MQCSAQHQAVRHHTISTDGAARHAGCSGPTRPCVTARRRRQGSVGQVRECTGPAMPQHTYTQRAHNTHSPARLPVPAGRHPGLCLLVIAPSAHHTTPHHTTPHHTTPHHTTPHHVMSCHGALEPSSAGPPSGRLSAERLAVTHTRTPMEWAPGEGGPRAPCMARRREAPGPSKVHHGRASGRSETPVPPTGPGFLGTGGSHL